jgi:phosphohistidine phosphatase
MKRLLLLRHAKAVPAEAAFADFARELSERGERDAHHIGERLREHQPRPDLILASPAARTLRTAQLVAAALGYADDAIAVDPLLYLAAPPALLQVIAAQSADVDSLVVVGHNPGLTELVHELLPTFDVDDLPTSAIAALEYSSAHDWRAIQGAAARLVYYDFPKNTAPPFTAR